MNNVYNDECISCAPQPAVGVPCCAPTCDDKDLCQLILDEFCTDIHNAITYSDCMCDDFGSEIPLNLSEEYMHKIIQNIVDSGRCDNKARVFYFGSCEEMANASRNLMCCPKEGDIAFVHNPENHDGTNGGFDVYMLHPISEIGMKEDQCGEYIKLADDCPEFAWETDCCGSTDMYHTSMTISSSGLVTITSNNGAPTLTGQITFPTPPPQINQSHVFVNYSDTGTLLKSTAFGTYSKIGSTQLTVPKDGVYLVSWSGSLRYRGPALDGTITDNFELHSFLRLEKNGDNYGSYYVGSSSSGACRNNAGDSSSVQRVFALKQGDKLNLSASMGYCVHRPLGDISTTATITISSISHF